MSLMLANRGLLNTTYQEAISYQTFFDATEASNTLGTPFTLESGELKSTGSNGFKQFFTHDRLSCGDLQRLYCEFRITDAASAFGLLKYYDNSITNLPASNSYGEVDFGTQKLNIYSGFTASTLGTITMQADLTIITNTSHNYSLEYKKIGTSITLTIVNITLNEKQSISYDYKSTGSIQVFRGKPGINHRSGTVYFSKFGLYFPTNKYCDLLVIGDSYVDGHSLFNDYKSYLDEKYAWKIKTYLGDKCSTHGWGGARAYDWWNYFKESCLDPFIAKYVLIQIGYNDNIYANYNTNITNLINYFEGKGTTVILTKLAPLTTVAAASFITTINSFIDSSGKMIFDEQKVMTKNGDGINIDSLLLLSDGAHPSLTCHNLLYYEFMTNTMSYPLNPNNYDHNVLVYRDKLSLSDATLLSALSTFISSAKSNGYYYKWKSFYLLFLNDQNKNKFNFKNPYDYDSFFRLAFTGSWTVSTSGITGGSGKYADTNYKPSVNGSLNNQAAFIYIGSDVAENLADFGVQTIATNRFNLYSRLSSDIYDAAVNSNYATSTSNTSSLGLFVISRVDSSNLQKQHRNNYNSYAIASGTLAAYNLTLGALNQTGTPGNNSTKQFRLFGISFGLTQTEMGNLYTDIQTFMTAIGLNV